MIGGEIWASVRGETTGEGRETTGKWDLWLVSSTDWISFVNGDFDFCDFAVLTVLVV